MKLVPPAVERRYYAVTGPLIQALIRAGVRPNTLTTIGTALVVASAVAFGAGAIRFGGLLLLLSGLLDTLDGAVARGSGAATKFGAFYDSTLDRIGDGATFIGIAAYLLYTPGVAYRELAIVLCMVATLATLVVSYARARAEGLGLDCKVGFAQRAERIIGLGLASLVVGAGPRALVLEAIVAILAVAGIVTVVQRFRYVYRITGGADAPRRAPEVTPAATDTYVKG